MHMKSLAKRPGAGRQALGAVVLGSSLLAAAPQPLQDPPVFASKNGTLSVLLIAAKRPAVPVSTPLGTVTTDLWTYEVCNLPTPGANACPAGTSHSNLGGVRLALNPGDMLRVRLVNNLPTVTDANHIADDPYLINNPTNLHTHGLIVEPHRAVGPTDAFGDYVFAVVTNPANTVAPSGVAAGTPVHPGVDVVNGAAEYVYNIDATHPPGLMWFHPHLHGISLNQVNSGLAGALTIGSAADQCADSACVDAVNQSGLRHITLKDTQVASGGVLLTQPDPGFCGGALASPRQGTCPGQASFAGGTWLHTVNGQVYPQITVGGSGEVWRVLNASGSRSYQLSVIESQNGKPVPLQVIAIDGIALGSVSTTPAGAALMAGKIKPIPCPGQGAGNGQTICTETLRMMPSSRVDVRVLRRDNGVPDRAAIFRTEQYDTGDGTLGDHWPAIDLAAVTLASRKSSAPDQIAIKDTSSSLLSTAGQLLKPAALTVPGTTTTVSAGSASAAATPASGPAVQVGLTQAGASAISPQTLTGQTADPLCKPLASGNHRKILFGYPTPTSFGLGYVEVDKNGKDIEATRTPIREYSSATETVCVPLPSGAGVQETWELVNLTSEDHNFHIHQLRFFLLTGGVSPGTVIPASVGPAPVLHDNIPLPRPSPAASAAACDGTLETVQSGKCKPTSTFVSIPFREVGDFVFHCHILEHEDGGMMARIRVVLAKPGA
jgi:L-ascorbate oxidase